MANLRAVFLEALDLKNATERRSYLDDACQNDAELRKRVEALLAVEESADASFMAAPAVVPRPPTRSLVPVTNGLGPATRDGLSGPSLPAGQIGPYSILRQLGEGGMGLVYLAEQHEPVKRRVALKIVKSEFGSRESIARFESERQALAMMDHPNIARVHDAGATPDGRPYFAMELVEGIPLNLYCHEHALPLRERLKLFLDVCHAIQHAHQKGVIHRDIKPSNLLVMTADGKPLVKVIDFGIAKAIGTPLTDRTLATLHGSIIGTLEYMSPEQATSGAAAVDTRSDVYSLGAVLYELLTGTTPLDSERVRKTDIMLVLNAIRDEEPQRPSARITQHLSAGSAVRPVLALHAPDAKQLRGELDWIALKALEKDRARRYQSAVEFARDIERHLNDEPVEACPPTAWYRLAKLVRRNRWPFIAAASVTAALVVGLGVSAYLFFQERKARQASEIAEVEQERLRKVSDAALIEARSLRAASEKSEADARASALRAEMEFAKSRQVSEFLLNILRNIKSEQTRRDTTMVRDILDAAVKRMDTELVDQPEIEADLRQIIGETYLKIQDFPRAEATLSAGVSKRRALPGDNREGLMRDLLALANAMQYRNKPQMYKLILEAVEIRRTLPREAEPKLSVVLNHAGTMAMISGDFDAAEKFYMEELGLRKPEDLSNRIFGLQMLATLHHYSSNAAAAERLRALLQELRRDFDERAAREAIMPDWFKRFADVYKIFGDEPNAQQMQNRFDEARRKALESTPRKP